MTNLIVTIALIISSFCVGYGVGSLMELNRWKRDFDNLWNEFMLIKRVNNDD